MKLDAHQHFWKYNQREYSWINEDMPILRRDYLPEDLKKELHTTGFDGSIAVQARQCLEETRWLLELASAEDIIKGVVGWVDICSPQLDEQLAEFSEHTKFVGVRHVLQDEPDDNFMLKEEFVRGIGRLADYQLCYDLLIFPRHLLYAVELVKLFPEQIFVLDHIAKPNILNGEVEVWKAGIEELSKFPNVYCKLSGMVTEASWHKWKSSDFTLYLDVVMKSFGEDRLMIGSDWPVCKLAGEYEQVISLVAAYIESFDPDIQSKIFGENCARVYLKKQFSS